MLHSWAFHSGEQRLVDCPKVGRRAGNQAGKPEQCDAHLVPNDAWQWSFPLPVAAFSEVHRRKLTTLAIDAKRPNESARQPDQENPMAVQQNKKSPSKRGMHRSHNALVTPGIAIEPTTGEVHLRHHISPTGFYRGRKVLKSKADA